MDSKLIANHLNASLRESASIVLVGSFARNCSTKRSDVDILVVGERQPVFEFRSPNVEFHRFSVTKFVETLQSGDDFPSWCTRFGIPLTNNTYWESIVERAHSAKWPNWRKKLNAAARRLLACRLSLRTGDREASAESLVFAYDNLIRGILLKESTFPLARLELVEQIRPISPELGNCLAKLLHDSAHSLDFRRLLLPLKKTLTEIDPELLDQGEESFRRILSKVPA